jgi:hypothetical protein
VSNTRKPRRKPNWKLTYPPEIRPLAPGRPLAPYRVPPLKAFDRCMPGQGQLDFGSDGEITVIYPGGEED